MSGEQPTAEQTTSRDQPRIYVASLTDYNNGVLHGSWLDLDQEPDDLQAAIDQMLAASPTTARYGDIAEEWAIHDYEGFTRHIRLGEYEDLDRLRTIAAGIEQHGEAFAAWWSLEERQDLDSDRAIESFEQAYLGEYANLEAYGDEHLSESGFDLDQLDLPESLRPYLHLDTAGWARDLEIGGDIETVESSSGLFVFRSDD